MLLLWKSVAMNQISSAVVVSAYQEYKAELEKSRAGH